MVLVFLASRFIQAITSCHLIGGMEVPKIELPCRAPSGAVAAMGQRLQFFAAWPSDRQQKCGLALRLYIMLDGSVEHQQIAGIQGKGLFGRAELDLTLDYLHGNSSVGVMLVHLPARLHDDEDRSEITLLEEGLCVSAGRPRFLLAGIGYLLLEVELDKRIDHDASIIGMAGCMTGRIFQRSILSC